MDYTRAQVYCFYKEHYLQAQNDMGGSMITRLEKLKAEMKIVQALQCLRFDLMEECVDHYEHEIKCIECFGSPNPVYDDED